MACSRIFSGDIPELLNDIIKNFRGDFTTLHSFILVNRLWCRLAIPLLWENPFSVRAVCKHDSVDSQYSFYNRKFRFIEIYLTYLNDDYKNIFLKEYEFNLFNSFSSNTLFDYPSFIK